MPIQLRTKYANLQLKNHQSPHLLKLAQNQSQSVLLQHDFGTKIYILKSKLSFINPPSFQYRLRNHSFFCSLYPPTTLVNLCPFKSTHFFTLLPLTPVSSYIETSFHPILLFYFIKSSLLPRNVSPGNSPFNPCLNYLSYSSFSSQR